jgi:CBS domain-containing protein
MTAPLNNTERIFDIMKTDVLWLSPDMQVIKAMRLLLDHNYSCAPVISATGELLGILSRKDCLEAAINAHYDKTSGGLVSAYMTKKVEIIHWDMDLIAAANQFLNSRYRVFPVMDSGKLIGQISRSDVMAALVQHHDA